MGHGGGLWGGAHSNLDPIKSTVKGRYCRRADRSSYRGGVPLFKILTFQPLFSVYIKYIPNGKKKSQIPLEI